VTNYGLAFGGKIAPYTRRISAQLSQNERIFSLQLINAGVSQQWTRVKSAQCSHLASNLSESAHRQIATRSGGNQEWTLSQIVIDMPRNALSTDYERAQVLTVDYASASLSESM